MILDKTSGCPPKEIIVFTMGEGPIQISESLDDPFSQDEVRRC